MLSIPFFKYQGTGNDFVLIDQRERQFLTKNDQLLIEKICDRRFGIGADGLILLQNNPNFDFEMVYFNADGRESSMCGNGGRCIVAFAHFLKIFEKKCTFLAIDGIHDAAVLEKIETKFRVLGTKCKAINLKMGNVSSIETQPNSFVLNTGSPHFVAFLEKLEEFDVFTEGRKIRNSTPYIYDGINVNFVEILAENHLRVATYERGVEAETFSCGTGVTAAAIAYFVKNKEKTAQKVAISTKGGDLTVCFQANEQGGFDNIWLSGPTEQVFSGKINI
jgi:diaminopimelate epimerase